MIRFDHFQKNLNESHFFSKITAFSSEKSDSLHILKRNCVVRIAITVHKIFHVAYEYFNR